MVMYAIVSYLIVHYIQKPKKLTVSLLCSWAKRNTLTHTIFTKHNLCRVNAFSHGSFFFSSSKKTSKMLLTGNSNLSFTRGNNSEQNTN